jgi:predicted lysophospholipase L1 biosynthesis ABC-type transport system permease subunit
VTAREGLGIFGYADLLVTPAALGSARPFSHSASYLLRVDPADPDAHERARNTASRIDPRTSGEELTDHRTAAQVASIRRGLLLGAIATLLLAGASMLVNVLEQLRDRRRQLAVLVAFGTRRRTLGWSVLTQTTIPVLLGLGLAVGTGVGVGAALLSVLGVSVRFDWAGVAGICAAGALTVLGTTGASLPLLWRLTRPGELRTE